MSFLVVMRPARDGIESEQELLAAHWDYLRRLHADGTEIRLLRTVTR